MRSTIKTTETKASTKKRRIKKNAHEFETMSQIENRYGKGRERNGSDGGSGNENFSNR